jgi:hypothetical protein
MLLSLIFLIISCDNDQETDFKPTEDITVDTRAEAISLFGNDALYPPVSFGEHYTITYNTSRIEDGHIVYENSLDRYSLCPINPLLAAQISFSCTIGEFGWKNLNGEYPREEEIDEGVTCRLEKILIEDLTLHVVYSIENNQGVICAFDYNGYQYQLFFSEYEFSMENINDNVAVNMVRSMLDDYNARHPIV